MWTKIALILVNNVGSSLSRVVEVLCVLVVVLDALDGVPPDALTSHRMMEAILMLNVEISLQLDWIKNSRGTSGFHFES